MAGRDAPSGNRRDEGAAARTGTYPVRAAACAAGAGRERPGDEPALPHRPREGTAARDAAAVPAPRAAVPGPGAGAGGTGRPGAAAAGPPRPAGAEPAADHARAADPDREDGDGGRAAGDGGRDGRGRAGGRPGHGGRPHPLARIRRAHGWSHQDVARVVAEHARALGAPMAARREKVWRWEHWGVVPEQASQRALARALGVPFGELERRPWPEWLEPGGPVVLTRPWTRAQALAALDELLRDGGINDASPDPLLAGEALGTVLDDWSAAASAGPLPKRVRGERDIAVDHATVAWLANGLAGLRRLHDRLGGSPVRGRVEADLHLTADLLRRGERDRGRRTQLLRIAADLAALGGHACTDLGCHAAAQRLHLTGLRLAHAASDRALAVAQLAGLSLQSLCAGQPGDALVAAEAAAAAAPVGIGPPRVRALLAARRARAYALLGRAQEARRALAAAEELMADAGTQVSPPWVSFFDAAELACQSGTVLLDLGQAEAAAVFFDRGLARQDRSRVQDRAVYLARAARARLAAGDTEGGRRLAGRAAELAGRCGGRRPAAAVADVAGRLAGGCVAGQGEADLI